MQRSLGLAVGAVTIAAVTVAAVLIGGTSLASAQDPCPRGQTPSTTDPCTPQPDTTVSGRPGTTVSFSVNVPPEQCSASGSWCHVARNIRWSACRGPFTLVSSGLVGIEERGTRMAVDLLESDVGTRYLKYLYVGQRTLEIDLSGSEDPTTRETVSCSLSGVVRINVAERSGTIYGYTVPADVERNNPHTEGPDVWVVVTPGRTGVGYAGASVGYTDPQCLNCQVGGERSDGQTTLVRVGDLPICPTLPPGERPDHQCRVRG